MSLHRMTRVCGIAGLAWFGLVFNARAGTPININGTIGYGPLDGGSVASVPTLGQWGLALLVLLASVVAYRALRGRVGGRLMAHLLLGGTLAALTWGGAGALRGAWAIVPPVVVNLSAPSGGSVTVSPGVSQLSNNSGVVQQIKSMAINNAESSTVHWDDPTPSSPQCQVGTTVQPGASCYVFLTFPIM